MKKLLIAAALLVATVTSASAGGGVYVGPNGFAFGYNRGWDGGWYPNFYGPTIYAPYFRPAPYAYGPPIGYYAPPRWYRKQWRRRHWRD